MPYRRHFKHADDIVSHLNLVVPTISDPLLRVKYVGFVTVAAITVYELAIKEIFITFAKKKHKVLGTFTERHFDRINGRIKTKMIEDEYLPHFGDKYVLRFRKCLKKAAADYLKAHKRDIRSAYSNLITWRNDFAHGGNFNATATYAEVVQSYEDGKEIVRCLAKIMVR
jgi:hypothetical protein